MSTHSEVVVHRFASEVLKGNRLKDPFERNLCVYLPPGHDSGRSFPTLLALAGFGGSGMSFFNYDPIGEDLKSRLDRLIQSGQCAPVIVVAPDCFTKLGGNQYINSEGTGRYEDYLVREVVPFVNERHPVKRWGVFGKSSGGFGAVVLGMRNPDLFEVLADHSGDSNFELSLLPEIPDALNAYKKLGGLTGWWEHYNNDINKHRREYMKPLLILAMAAFYSPAPKSEMGVDLPFSLETGKFLPEVWERWRSWDPVNMVSKYAPALKKLRYIYVDCGTRDEFGLYWGAKALVHEMKKHGIDHQFEEFSDGHMSISYRLDVSLPKLVSFLDK